MEWGNEKDFVCRTKFNLELYNSCKKGRHKGFNFEVTQLINSFLGLIVFVKEIGVVSNKGLEEFLSDNQPKKWNYKYDNKEESHNFYNYLRHIRNAIAHPDKKLIVEASTEGIIEKIIFKDFYKDEKKGNYFETTLTIAQIEKLINLLYVAFLNQDKCKKDGIIDG